MRIFGKGKCKLIANFSAKMVTSLPSASVSLSLSLSLSPSAPHAQYRKRGTDFKSAIFLRYQHVFDSFCQIHVDIEKKKKKKKKRHGQVCQARVVSCCSDILLFVFFSLHYPNNKKEKKRVQKQFLKMNDRNLYGCAGLTTRIDEFLITW